MILFVAELSSREVFDFIKDEMRAEKFLRIAREDGQYVDVSIDDEEAQLLMGLAAGVDVGGQDEESSSSPENGSRSVSTIPSMGAGPVDHDDDEMSPFMIEGG